MDVVTLFPRHFDPLMLAIDKKSHTPPLSYLKVIHKNQSTSQNCCFDVVTIIIIILVVVKKVERKHGFKRFNNSFEILRVFCIYVY